MLFVVCNEVVALPPPLLPVVAAPNIESPYSNNELECTRAEFGGGFCVDDEEEDADDDDVVERLG